MLYLKSKKKVRRNIEKKEEKNKKQQKNKARQVQSNTPVARAPVRKKQTQSVDLFNKHHWFPFIWRNF